MTLELPPDAPGEAPGDAPGDVAGAAAGDRLVAVAIDAAGAGGGRPYTYRVPESLADLEDGEAVLVEFGRRQALGVILGPAEPVAGVVAKPIVDRIRADGPLLPPLALGLATWIADHYLAPPGLVVRSMLPPGLLERLELVAERVPGGDDVFATGSAPAAPSGPAAMPDPVEADLFAQLEAGARPVRELAAPDGRAGLLRRLRALAADGAVTLDWTLLGASGGPRHERWISLTDAGATAAAVLAAGERPPGRPLGPRQVAALADLAALGAGSPVQATAFASTHGTATIPGLARRGLIASEVRVRPRRPLASRPVGVRGGRPPATDLSPEQAVAVARVVDAIERRDPRPLLLDGVTGGGKTAVYVEAIAAALALGRPALVLVPEIALALPLVDRLRADLDARVALVHSGSSIFLSCNLIRRINNK